jgi:hypothetical protein
VDLGKLGLAVALFAAAAVPKALLEFLGSQPAVDLFASKGISPH